MKILIWTMFIVIVFYNIVDVVQTKMLINLGVGEGNPMLKYLIDLTGKWEIIIYVKLGMLSLLATGLFLKLR